MIADVTTDASRLVHFQHVMLAVSPDADATTANSEEVSFDIEYRWDRLPEEDEQAGMSLIFLVSLIATAILAIDVCNSVGDENVAVSRRGQNGSEAKLSSGYNGGMRIRDEPWQR